MLKQKWMSVLWLLLLSSLFNVIYAEEDLGAASQKVQSLVDKESPLKQEMQDLIKNQREVHNAIVEANENVALPKSLLKKLQKNLNKACLLGFAMASKRAGQLSNQSMNEKLCQCISGNKEMVKASVMAIRTYPNFDTQGVEANKMMMTTMAPVSMACLKKLDHKRYEQTQTTFKSYTLRAHVASGIALSAKIKTAVLMAYMERGQWPTSLKEIGVEDIKSNKSVENIKLGSQGEIVIVYRQSLFNPNQSGHVLVLKPEPLKGQFSGVRWRCGNGTTLNAKLLPAGVCQ